MPREMIPGEIPLSRFTIIMDEVQPTKVVEMDIILHYRDEVDTPLVKANITSIHEAIYLYTKQEGQQLLTDMEKRTAFQAKMLDILNNIPALKTDPSNPRLTYMQISLLRAR
jgi:hypothetical protein